MRKLLLAILLVSLIYGKAEVVGAEDQSVLKAIIDKGVKAVGGEGLAKFKAATWKGKGTFYGLGDGITYTGEWAVQPPEMARIETAGEVDGNKTQRILIVNGDKGWEKLDATIVEINPEKLAEEKERLFANWVTTLAPFLNNSGELTPLGEKKVNDRVAVGIQATFNGHHPVKLYFDKENYLLLKSETQVKNPESGSEAIQEAFYSEYKDFDGLKRATKITVKVDGKLYAEGEISDFKPQEKLDNTLFAKPTS